MALEEEKRLRHETNVLIPVRINELGFLSTVSLCLALAAVVNFATNVVTTVLVSIKDATSDQVFHNIEFTAAMLFALVQLLAVFYSYDRSSVMERPLVLKAVVFINLAGSIVPAVLVYVNLERFEVPAHQVEYSNTLFSALVDMLMIGQIAHKHFASSPLALTTFRVALAIVPVGVAAAMLSVYNAMGWTDDGDSKGEKNAHYLEFSFEMLSSIITFWFCMDNKIRSDQLGRYILLAAPEEAQVIAMPGAHSQSCDRKNERSCKHNAAELESIEVERVQVVVAEQSQQPTS